MEDNHSAIVALYRSGMKPLQIFKELKSIGVSQSQVYRAIKRYLGTGSSKKRHGGGRRRTARIAANIGRLRKRLQRNPRQSSRKSSKSTGISRSTVMRIVKEDLGLKPFKLRKVQELSSAQKGNRLTRSRALLKRPANGELENMVLFSDEKIFTVEQVLNRKNDRLWLKERSPVSSSLFNIARKQGPLSIIVWAGITESGRTPLVFSRKGIQNERRAPPIFSSGNTSEAVGREAFRECKVDISTGLCSSSYGTLNSEVASEQCTGLHIANAMAGQHS
ncbi:hypothetical protein ANCDUO_08608 [Ancylostoma duodenale]|uniref:Paired domain-containing protein n=1 Tax=Ancylostoma duodenale TaxID=51022 RepID=A0A0C2GIU1_9BILA|nr:hypothetical protein ANCDUO_08608 [Ancylostoma duodenale]